MARPVTSLGQNADLRGQDLVTGRGHLHQLQPLVVPQDSQTWQLPARFIFTPQPKHIGASWSTGTDEPSICGSSLAAATDSAVGAVGTAGAASASSSAAVRSSIV